MSPTARTLRYLRSIGHTAEVVERFNSFTKRRRDLFGFADVVSVSGGRVHLWQATSGAHVAARVAKVRAAPLFPAVSLAASVSVIGWTRYKLRRGGRAVRWRPRVVEVRAGG